MGIGKTNVTAVLIPHLIQSIDSMKGIRIRSGSLGENHTILITESNRIIAFGSNIYGQCSSTNTSKAILSPRFVSNNEINNNSHFLINKVIAGNCFSIVVMNVHLFHTNKKIYQQTLNNDMKRKYNALKCL